MGLPLYVVHAFADRPFAGNPAAVCFPAPEPSDRWMQQVAAEMRLSETAFLTPEDGGYRLRWFTPTIEVDLCGHATLASAHVLWETGRLHSGTQARFHTKSGLVTVDQDAAGMTMDFPARVAEPCREWPDLPSALGAKVRFVGRNGMDGLVELEDDRSVRSLNPDIELLSKYPIRGLIVTARSNDAHYDFVSRFFAPRAGVPEDPVTGSAHCCLGPYWSERLGKRDLVAYQASARGGIVRVGIRGNRVQLGGRAVTVLSGEWHAGTLA
jgi:PhzF family phenazine biosynthesis protein